MRDWLEGLLTTIGAKVAVEFFDAVARPDGLDALRKEMEHYFDRFVLVRAMPLIDDNGRLRFERLVADAATRRDIQLNLLDLFRFMAHQLDRRAHFGGTGIWNNVDVVNAIWRGAAANRLNIRLVGSLREEHAAMQAGLGGVTLTLPAWWPSEEPDEGGGVS